MADKIADKAMLEWTKPTARVHPDHNIYLQVDGEAITSNEMKILRWRWREFELQEYYETRYGWSMTLMHTINWTALRMARSRMTRSVQTFSTKVGIGWLATGTRMSKYGKEFTTCCLCGNDEDYNHLFTCPNRDAQRDTFFTNFRDNFPKEGSQLVEQMIAGIKDSSQGIEQTDHRQHSIGWLMILRGFTHDHWAQQ